MRSFPDFAEIKAGALRPMPDAVMAKGRYLVGALALGGAFFYLGAAEPASAAPTGASVTLAAPAAQTPARSSTSTTQSYTIKPGDTLTSIASAFGTSVATLVSQNGIGNQHFIVAGETLQVPRSGTASAASTSAKKTTRPTPAPSSSSSAAASAPKASASITSETRSVGSSTAGQVLPQEMQGSSRAELNQHFVTAAKTYGVPAELMKALAYQESGWNNSKVSNTGAIGVGQLMPATIDFINSQLLDEPLDPTVASQNIRMSTAYFAYLLRQNKGDETLALASYYQGLRATREIGLYDDTKEYLASINAIRSRWF